VKGPLGNWGADASPALFADAIKFVGDDLHWHRQQAEAFV
jgi:hypothetical protein